MSSRDELRSHVDATNADISVQRQCELLGLPRSSYYYQAIPESAENLKLMRLIDEKYTETPFFGSRKIVKWLEQKHNLEVNRKRIQRLMRLMGIEAIYPKPRLTFRDQEHKVYPYLLRGVSIDRPNQVWSTDITYIPMRQGFLYLTAIIDWYSRFVLSWELSNSLDASFCVTALERALRSGAKPEIFNTDQGCQFTSRDFIAVLESAEISISMDGKGRCIDNILCERLWRSVKYEEIYLKDYLTGAEAAAGIRRYFDFYNSERYHQSLGYATPASVYNKKGGIYLN